MKTTEQNVCKNCKNWKSQQAELDYSTLYGICTCYNWKFQTWDNPDVKLLDRNSRSKKYMGVHTFENQSSIVPIGEIEKSQYCFVTNEFFGCINFKK